jgi:hypothetical protein
MRAKMLVVVPAFVLILGACTVGGAVRPEPTGSSPASDVLLVDTDRGPIAISSGTGAVLSDGSGAVAGPDGSRLYAATSDGTHTQLVTIEATTGAVASSIRMRGELDVRVASVSGKAVALMAPLPAGVDPWTPVPRSRTTIVVADPAGSSEPHRYHLKGNFEPEAFSVEDSRLFLIQYLPAEAPAVYRVTVLDLRDGDVYGVHGRFKTAPERMPGIRLRQVFDAQTSQLYTLYTTKPRAYAQDYGSWNHGDEPETFVHVLNLQKGWAYCAGLPKELWGQPAASQTMATSPDGKLLYIVDSTKGVVSVMDTHTLEILRTEHAALTSPDGVRTSAQVSADGRTLFVGSLGDGSMVDVIDTTTFAIEHHWTMAAMVLGLGLSDDGLRLYVGQREGVTILDALTGAELTAVPVLGVESILHVGTLDA